MENLLEKMIKKERTEELTRLDAVRIVNDLFSKLLDRERDILSRRFGLLSGRRETLEKIGQEHQLTRERVRQIESASIKKIKKLDDLEGQISILKQTVYKLLKDHGGLVRREYLLDMLTVMSLEIDKELKYESDNYEAKRATYHNHFDFILSRLMDKDLELIAKDDNFYDAYKIKDESVNYLEELADDLLAKVDLLKKTYTTEELLELLRQLDAYNKYQEKFKEESESNIFKVFKSKVFPDKAEIINSNKVLYSFIQAIKNLGQNRFGDWGLSDSQEIKPKTINDKIYLVLKHEKQPLHFTEIAARINEVKFDKKTANAATVHNELILDNRYVLTGRGTYGLTEWSR